MIAHALKDVEQGDIPPLWMGVQTCGTIELNMGVPQKTGNWSTSRPSYSTFGHNQRMFYPVTKILVQVCS